MAARQQHEQPTPTSLGTLWGGSRRGFATVGRSPSNDPVLGQLAHTAALALGFDQGRILLEPAPDAAESKASEGGPSDMAEAAPSGPWARLDSLVRQRATSLVIRNVLDDPITSSGPGPIPPQPASLTGAYVGVPIWVGNDVVGVLRVTDDEPRTVAVGQVRLLVELSRLASLHLRPGAADTADDEPDRAEADLSRAVRVGEIIPWYQPIVDLATGRVTGVEALARWRRESGRLEPPSAFVPVAERSDLIIDLDFAVIRAALRDLARWHRTRPDFRLSLNLSGRHLDRATWLSDILFETDRAGVGPETLDLELTETARPTDVERGSALIESLRRRGYRVWFDDFGAGFYDLQDLVRFPVDGLKIDRSFAEQLDQPMNAALVGALTAAARRVGLRVTIEGIETLRQAELAHTLGCDYGQGFFWSPPVPAADVVGWLRPAEPQAGQATP